MGKITGKELEDLLNETPEHTWDPKDSNYFENFCSACDNFRTDNCPFRERATLWSRWKEEFRCEHFYD